MILNFDRDFNINMKNESAILRDFVRLYVEIDNYLDKGVRRNFMGLYKLMIEVADSYERFEKLNGCTVTLLGEYRERFVSLRKAK